MRSILSLNVYINGYKQHDIYSYMQPQVNNMDNKSRPVLLETRLHPMHANASDIFYSFYLRFTLPILLGTKTARGSPSQSCGPKFFLSPLYAWIRNP